MPQSIFQATMKACALIPAILLTASCTEPSNATPTEAKPAPENAPMVQRDKPNIVFIAVDDLNVYNTVLGNETDSFLRKVYPNPEVRDSVLERLTPNLNRLAEQSLTFNRAYSAAPLCGPSRTALMTGVPPHQSHYYAHEKHFRGHPSLTNATTLPQYLKSQGYFTTGAGKVFHKGRSYLDRGYFSDWPDQIYSWNHWVEVHSGTGINGKSDTPASETVSKYWPAPEAANKQFTRFGVTTVPRTRSNDYVNARFGAELITQGTAKLTNVRGDVETVTLPKTQPWFVAIGLFAPHLPWVVEQEYHDLFPTNEMAIDRELLNWVHESIQDLSPTGLKIASQSKFVDIIAHGKQLEGDEGELNAWREAFQSYLATVAYSDRNIGELVDAIARNSEKDNTVVVLWADHGYHIGDKNREAKTTLWEGANHTNLIVLDPRKANTTKGLRTQATVSLQDLYPTIVSMAGLPRPQGIYGYDLTPILDSPDAQWEPPVLNTHLRDNHALRTDQYRYIRFANGDQELYDMIEDPHEFTNLARNPAYAETLKTFNQQLDQVLQMTPDDYASH
ncbi:sulfatase [Echinimonas agarilytica]|uniref:Sulfatase n=1 Tax=Echinimonas agarilytica TaxID=1215918 RepID=A0AA42BAI4_9GAMM|nr:sulfatase [Echinimonas agarilytica]MCM2681386.1 sulfatase [Echinimonas agarilytica]